MCVCVWRARAIVCVCMARARDCVCVRERERERQTDRQTDRQTEGRGVVKCLCVCANARIVRRIG